NLDHHVRDDVLSEMCYYSSIVAWKDCANLTASSAATAASTSPSATSTSSAASAASTATSATPTVTSTRTARAFVPTSMLM
ncbi:unnamed protein product, partial [Sphagnum troendelagicum]